MGESDDASTNVDLEALRALQADAQELECIQSLLGRFNIFEAIGFVGQELMHSQFLASLLDPKQNHGLGDLFLKRVLREALASTDDTPLPAFFESLGKMDLNGTLVRRKHQRTDLLLTNEAHKLAVVIENKIWTTEHPEQLGRYHRIVQGNHPDWGVFGIYLTPHGHAPSHEAYRPLGYGAVCEIIDGVLADRGSAPAPDVKMSLEHYVQMVRRHLVGDPEIARLCQQIYRKHRRAFDLIYEHRFADREAIGNLLIGLLKDHPNLVFKRRVVLKGRGFQPPKEFISFGVRGWADPALHPTAWQKNADRNLGFTLAKRPDSLDLKLEVVSEQEETRRKVFEMAYRNLAVFKDPPGSVIPNCIFVQPLLTSEFYKDASGEEREIEIRKRLTEFLQNDLPRIEEALRAEAWIWESTETEGPT